MEQYKRNLEIDLLKGYGIFLMVFNHIGWGTLAHSYIQSFHMPLFFIASGFLYKNERPRTLAKKRMKTLLIPYFVVSISFLLISIVEAFVAKENIDVYRTFLAIVLYPTDKENMPIASALWFLPCMFFCNIIYSVLENHIKRSSIRYLVITGIAAGGSAYSALMESMLPLCIEPLTVSIFFMMVGEIIKDKYIEFRGISKKYMVIALLLAFEAILALLNGGVDLRSATYNIPPLYIINAILGVVAYWGISIIFSQKYQKQKLPEIMRGVQLLCYLSRNAISFLCFNQLYIALVNRVVSKIEIVSFYPVNKIVTVIAVLILCGLTNECCRKTPFRVLLGK